MMRGLAGPIAGTVLCLTLVPAFNSKAANLDAATSLDAVAQPGVMANFITAGNVDPKARVPALNAVPGAGVQNLSVALPVSVLLHGTAYQYLMSSENVTFKGRASILTRLTGEK